MEEQNFDLAALDSIGELDSLVQDTRLDKVFES